MRLKTHFKFLFNSSKISTSSVHVIFFLNTRLHHDPNKIGITPFGSTNLEIYILQNNIKTGIFELSYCSTVTNVWDPWGKRSHRIERAEQRSGGWPVLARRWQGLRQGQGHRCVLLDNTHLSMPSPQPLPNSNTDDGMHGGWRRKSGDAPARSGHVGCG